MSTEEKKQTGQTKVIGSSHHTKITGIGHKCCHVEFFKLPKRLSIRNPKSCAPQKKNASRSLTTEQERIEKKKKTLGSNITKEREKKSNQRTKITRTNRVK